MDAIPIQIKTAIGAVVRTLLAGLIAWAVGRGYVTEGGASEIVALLTTLISVAAWSLWQKSQAQQREEIALSLPKGSTPKDIDMVQGIEKNAAGKKALALLAVALTLPFSACGKPEQLARGAAQAYVGMNGIADGIAIMARNGEIGTDDARKGLAGLGKVNLTAEVFSQRLQAGGYSKADALTAANQVLVDLRALYNQQLFTASEPAKVRWQLLFFAAETGINTAKLVIAKKQESKTEARKAAIAAGDALRSQITAHAQARGISPAALTELIALAQRVTVDIVTVSLMGEAEAWQYRHDLADALKTKLSQ